MVAHARLFRRLPGVRWRYRVHEQILLSVHEHGGTTRPSDVVIRHDGYRDPALYQGKLDRNHRLLALDAAEAPDDPFGRFYQGYTLMLLGRPAEAVPLLRHSRACAPPGMSILPKIHALLGQCLVRLGRRAEVLAACREGLRTAPADTELLFLEANLLQEAGDRPAAEARFRALLGARPETAYSGLDAGLRGYKARHNLAVLYRDQKRYAEAEAAWAAVVAEEPGFAPAWLGLGELYLARGRGDDVRRVLETLDRAHPGAAETAVLRARWLAHGGDVPAARAALEGAVARAPRAAGPRLALARLLARDARDPAAAERVLRELLDLEPGHPEAERLLARVRGREPSPG
ncbi:MAG TPA: tetratricopeptide repeat protein [Urbifossiella sp.]|jgi:tetratricopeptide (TPR) repeat protein|nr:tetratricopeptide repeat protein [Urbifossiella sp.]